MAEHSPNQKPHATWAASATAKNWQCAGALTLSELVAHLEKESEAAGWGTACHEVSEICLKGGHDAVELIDRTMKTKEQEFVVDEEMAETAQVYIDYVRRRQLSYPVGDPKKGGITLQVEQRFALDKLNPPFDAGGTADAVIYYPAEKLLEVIDLKGGRGVKVDVNENKQLRTYALGAVLANPGLDVERVMSTIVQPRIQHKDGVIRSETYHIVDLMEWTAELLVKMHESAAAKKAYAATTGELSREAWGEKYLKAGDHCSDNFCPARGICPALKKAALEKAALWFDDGGVPQLSNTPDVLSPEELEKMLEARDLVEGFFKACASLAHALAERGTEFKNYHLVDKIGRRRFKSKDDEKKLREELFLAADVTDDEAYNDPKIKTPAQIEKAVGTKRAALIAKLIETPVTGTNLVSKTKTTRPAAKSTVAKNFQPIEE